MTAPSRRAIHSLNILLAIGGCAEPTAELIVDEGQRPGDAAVTSTPLWPMSWDPIGGGLDEAVRTRHFIPVSIDGCEGATRLVDERFDDFATDGDTWRPIGVPQYRIGADESGNSVLRFTGVASNGRAGLTRDLPPMESGGTLLCSVKTLLPNAVSASRLGLPTIAFEFDLGERTMHRVVWPIVPAASPGWETQWFVWTPPAGVERLRLVLSYEGAVASVAFDDLAIWAFRPDAPITPPLPPRLGDNVLAGGNFEAGPGDLTVTHEANGMPCDRSLVSDAAAGERSLFVPLRATQTLVTFPPVHVSRTGPYALSWRGKGSGGARVRTMLSCAGESLTGEFVELSGEWRLASEVFEIPSSWFDRDATLTMALSCEDAQQRGAAWLDAVALVRGDASIEYAAPNECEIGFLDGWDNPLDLARVLHLDQSPGFIVRCVNDAPRARSCTLAIDVIDAMDRVVAQEACAVLLPARGAVNRAVTATPPTGYFRVLASLWPGAVGQGRPLARAERSVVLGNVLDPVPRGARCGINVSGAACSGRLTQLGIGWVRWTPDDGSDPTLFIEAARNQSLEVLGVGPTTAEILDGRMDENLVAIERRATEEPLESPGGVPRLDGVTLLLSDASSPLRPTLEGAAGQVVSFEETGLPESILPAIERLRRDSTEPAVGVLWDVRTPLAVAGASRFRAPEWVTSPSVGDVSSVGLDAAVEATHAVRRYVLRWLGGVSRIAFDPRPAFAGASVVPWMLADADHSPLPVVAALDFMNSRFNRAELLGWYELGGDVRACGIDVGGHSTVALMWRSFGRRPTWVRLAGLAGRVRVYNAFGSPEHFRTTGEDAEVPVSSFVIYVTCSAGDGQALLDALATSAAGAPD